MNVLNDDAVAQRDCAVATIGNGLFVRNNHDCFALSMQIVKDAEDESARSRIQVTRWLVCKDDERVIDERSGDGRPLLLTARKLCWPMVATIRKPDDCYDIAGFGPSSCGWTPLIEERHLQVFQNRELRNEVEVLEDEPDSASADVREFVVIQGGDVHISQEIPA